MLRARHKLILPGLLGGPSLDPAAAAYLDGKTVTQAARVNTFFSGLRSAGLLDKLWNGFLGGSGFNDPSSPTYLDGAAMGVPCASHEWGHFKTDQTNSALRTMSDPLTVFTAVTWYQGFYDGSYTGGSNHNPIRVRTDPFSFPTDYGWSHFSQTSAGQPFGVAGGGSGIGGYDADNVDWGITPGVAAEYKPRNFAFRQTLTGTPAIDQSQDGASFAAITGDTPLDFGAKNMDVSHTMFVGGLHLGGLIFKALLTDAEIEALHDIARATFYGRGIRLVVEGDSFTSGANTSWPSYLSTQSDLRGQFNAITNLGTGGDRLTTIATDWAANDPAAPYVGAGEMPHVVFALNAGQNDLGNGVSVATATAAADDILSRAKELGMLTVYVSTCRTQGISDNGTLTDVEALNTAVSALDSCDQFVDVNDYFRTNYGDSYFTDTAVWDPDGIHPSDDYGKGKNIMGELFGSTIAIPDSW